MTIYPGAILIHPEGVKLSQDAISLKKFENISLFQYKRLIQIMALNIYLNFIKRYLPGVSLTSLLTPIVLNKMEELKDSIKQQDTNTLITSTIWLMILILLTNTAWDLLKNTTTNDIITRLTTRNRVNMLRCYNKRKEEVLRYLYVHDILLTSIRKYVLNKVW